MKVCHESISHQVEHFFFLTIFTGVQLEIVLLLADVNQIWCESSAPSVQFHQRLFGRFVLHFAEAAVSHKDSRRFLQSNLSE